MDPTPGKGVELLDYPSEGMEASKKNLEKLGAIVVDHTTGTPSITPLGAALNSLPLSLELGKAIITAARLECTESVAIIACMLQVPIL